MTEKTSSLVWMITGCSSGLGRTLAERVLATGARVALTARKPEQLAELVANYPETSRAITLDVTDPAQARSAVAATVEAFGRLDVLVNNAGFGLLGALEEVSDEQIRANIETNLIGPLNVIRAALPTMRAQGAGHIINMSAIASFSNEQGFAVYGGTKAALDAASESLKSELAPLGIKVTTVLPGPFRTEFISRSLARGVSMPEYESTVGKFADLLRRIDGRQTGDPAKAADAIIQIAGSEDPPFRLVLGKYAYDKFRKKLNALANEHDQWQDLGQNTDF